MTAKPILLQLIDKLEEYLEHLEELQKYSLEEFKGDWKIFQLVDHSLHLAIECSIDMGKILVIEKKLRKPRTYRETFDILGQSKMISISLAEELKYLVEFRNRLIHEYLFLQLDEIYSIYQKRLDTFKGFIKVVRSSLKK